MKEVVIVSGARTAVGRFGGTLKDIPATTLGSIAIKGALERAGVSGDMVDWVLMGAASADGMGEVPARNAALQAGLPEDVPAMFLSAACTSGLFGVSLGAMMIEAGKADIVVAGGMESMSGYPYLIKDARWGLKFRDSVLVDGCSLALECPVGHVQMGAYGDEVAGEQGVTREEQDAWALRSQQRWAEAQEAGRLADEIVPVEIPQRKGDPKKFEVDEFPRPGTTLEALAGLKPAFTKDGTVTAGNAPGINDGAAVVVLMSADKAKELGIKPLGTVLAYGTVAGPPRNIPIVPSQVIDKVISEAGLKLEDIDLFEINEAFAAVSIITMSRLGIDSEKVNVDGGAVAIGHPVGATGVRILVHLLYELNRRGGGVGVAGLCGVGSQGEAVVVEV
ncbi:MAG: acetyl-CoA C-acyltransferase [Actinobacteria bacterium]|nr:acetyl-CoA C-acyltransferase [Actinomycetota bacterium]MBU1944207.1 acetyl-CoA C-acyltransferase [Actinomycetota bacterium]MBU2688400.1 acetyl-CoA C-acyltransferase [Actinomycetota bacterium]